MRATGGVAVLVLVVLLARLVRPAPVSTNGSESLAAEFTYRPKESIDQPGAGNAQEEVGTVVYANDFERAPGSPFPEWTSSSINFSNRFGLPLSGT